MCQGFRNLFFEIWQSNLPFFEGWIAPRRLARTQNKKKCTHEIAKSPTFFCEPPQKKQKVSLPYLCEVTSPTAIHYFRIWMGHHSEMDDNLYILIHPLKSVNNQAKLGTLHALSHFFLFLCALRVPFF